ncbi:MFS transporter [Imbroritus primus]|jgi:predicted MFS family arabinose efflux permease|uniref:MFS transporter n=1 Tax=Imbroritus primus TaxID=3058603 RepID=A0ACD3SL35_9BURK|nr:MFS transporter [Burkholderiaceae bacterium PBA]
MPSRLVILCLGNFVIGTGAMIVTGMLNEIAATFQIPATTAGQLITVFAFSVCLGAPLFGTLGSRIDRRLLLSGALAVYAVMHVLAALAPSFGTLMAARLFTAFGAAIYTPQAAATLSLLVPPLQRGRAISFVFLGWSIASVLGMPIGTWIATTLGWRVSMAVVATGAALAAWGVWRQLPRGLFVEPVGTQAWGAVLRHKPIMLVVATTAIQAAGLFTMFTYIAPMMRDVYGVTGGMLSLMFFGFGLCGVIGNALAANFMDRITPARVVRIALLCSLTALILWPLGEWSRIAMVALFMLWGLGGFATNSAQQARLITISPAAAPISVSLNSSCIYLGQALGAVSGAGIFAAAGPGALHWGAACFVLAAILISHRARLADTSTPPPKLP